LYFNRQVDIWHPFWSTTACLPHGCEATALSPLNRSAHGCWGRWAHLVQTASCLSEDYLTDLELVGPRGPHPNDTLIFADLKSRTKMLPQQFEAHRHQVW